MTDDLSAPLGQKTARRKRKFRLPFSAMQALAVSLGLFLVAFLVVALFTDNPFGGEPIARITLRQPADDKASASGSGKSEQAAKTGAQAPSGDSKTVTIIDGSSGKRQDVVIGSGDVADKGGADPARLAERARAQRHEILLQVPMEPFDYPDNDPGPQTLLTTLTPDQNIDRLHWHLSRFQGYAGIANFMGARFTATDTMLQPIIREAAKRGLGYLDDGSSPRSTAPSLTAAQAMPFAKADFTIDAVPTLAEIDRTLLKLETLAKERGLAVGVASSLPVSIERLATWIKTLESRGILLVPLTTAMLKSKSS